MNNRHTGRQYTEIDYTRAKCLYENKISKIPVASDKYPSLLMRRTEKNIIINL